MRIGPLGLPELLIILLVVLLIFGPRRLPDMAKGLGQSVREFRKGLKDMKEDFESEVNHDDKKGTVPAPSKTAPAATVAAPAATEATPAVTEASSPAGGVTPTEPGTPSGNGAAPEPVAAATAASDREPQAKDA